VDAPYQVECESSSVLFGASDHTGGEEGYNVYTYASGPYELNYSTSVNSVYIYTTVAGNVKIAIYNAQNTIEPPGWNPAASFTQYHPYQLLTQTQPTACAANSWNLINYPTVTLPGGIYFIAIKGDTAGMIGVSGLPPKKVDGAIYGYDQFIAQDYNTPFSGIFPQVEGAMGNDASVYIPTAEVSSTLFYFNQWSDGSTSQTRTINVNSNVALTVYYATGPTNPPPPTPTSPSDAIILLSIIAIVAFIGYYRARLK